MRRFRRQRADTAEDPRPTPAPSEQLTIQVKVDPAPPEDAALGITGLVGIDPEIVSAEILSELASGLERGPEPVRLLVSVKRPSRSPEQNEPELGVIVAGKDLDSGKSYAHRVYLTGGHGFTWGPGKEKERLADFDFIDYADAKAIADDGWVADLGDLGTVEFDADGQVTKIDVPVGEWTVDQQGQNRYYTQRGNSLLHATELLKAVGSVPELTYYTVETADGALSRDTFGFYTEGPIKTSGLTLVSSAPVPDTVESLSLTAYGDPMKSQLSVAQLKQQGHYANFILLMECGHCGYKSPVETQAGAMERECYCCGSMNETSRGTINVGVGSSMVEI
jgi:hypothetical protein